MKYLNILFLAAFILFAPSCEEQMVVIPEFTAEDTGRVVLIEEITGVRCPNCPAGAAAIAGFKQQFPGRVVSIAYHSPPFLVSPLEESLYDFRQQEAADFEQYIGEAIGKPSAAINRVNFSTEQRDWVDLIDSWAGYVVQELEKAPKLKLSINNEYNPDTREVTINVKGTPFEDATGDFRLTVVIMESHIIDAQEDPTTIIEDYEHNHVFHALVSSNIEGDNFANSFQTDVDIEKTFTFTLPAENGIWVAENCEIAAFVTEIEGDTKEVLQAVEGKVVE